MFGDKVPVKEPASDVAGAAYQGGRSEQQDAYRLRWIEREKAWLLVLADGMGGHAGGQIASKLAVDGFVAAFMSQRARGALMGDAFQAALEDANLRIAHAQRKDPALSEMGTTIVAAHVSDSGVCWISVGDSPMWVVRGGGLHRLNEDHSMRDLAGDAAHLRNMLQSVLNGQPIPMIDCHESPIELRPDDVLLVSSDGILTMNDDQIAHTVSRYANQGAKIVTQALLYGVSELRKKNQDNCTVIVAFPPAPSLASSNPLAFLQSLPVTRTMISTALSAIAGFASTLALYFIFRLF